MKHLRAFTHALALLLPLGTLSPQVKAEDKPVVARYPFRLLFNAYDGDPRDAAREKFDFQVNTIDLKQPSEFYHLGDTIRNTPWVLTKFEYKIKPTPPAAVEEEDLSELTLTNKETKRVVVLVLHQVLDLNAPVPKVSMPEPKK